MRRVIFAAAVAATSGAALGQIQVTNDNDPASLLNALVGGNPKLTVTNVTLSGNTFGGAVSTGRYQVQGPNGYNLTRGGIVLSTGDAAAYSTGPNLFTNNGTDYGDVATPGEENLLAPLDGFGSQHFDVTRLDITFDVQDFSEIAFACVFGSEEWSEFVGLGYTDPYGIYLNGTNIAFANGLPVNIDHPNMMDVPETELDGVLSIGGTARINYLGSVTPFSKGNTLTFILGDSTDGIYDTTVYIEGLVPAPGSAALLGLAGLAATRRRRA